MTTHVDQAEELVGPHVRRMRVPDGRDVWLVEGYDLCRQALTDPRFSNDMYAAARTWPQSVPPQLRMRVVGRLAKNMLASDPPDHTRLRKLAGGTFTTSRMKALTPRIEEITAELIDRMADAEVVDLLPAFARPLPVTVICELLGIPQAQVGRVCDRVQRTIDAGEPTDLTAKLRLAYSVLRLNFYFHRLIAQRRREPDDKLLSALVECHDADDRLTGSELLSMVFLLFVAGHETTVNLIGNGTLALLTNPDQLARLRADPTLIDAAVEECLRTESPVRRSVDRIALEDLEFGGVRIRAGDPVVVDLDAGNHDPQRFDAPFRFDVSRGSNNHLAFGHGIHHCLGAPLARIEGRIALRALIERFPDMHLAVPATSLEYRTHSLLNGLKSLPVRLR